MVTPGIERGHAGKGKNILVNFEKRTLGGVPHKLANLHDRIVGRALGEGTPRAIYKGRKIGEDNARKSFRIRLWPS